VEIWGFEGFHKGRLYEAEFTVFHVGNSFKLKEKNRASKGKTKGCGLVNEDHYLLEKKIEACQKLVKELRHDILKDEKW
jgi:hypothetical protein